MSVSISPAPIGTAAPRKAFRFGRESSGGSADEPSVQWLLKRDGSFAPHRLLVAFVGLLALTLCVAAFLWLQGAALAMPLAGGELIALGLAMVVYARHAADFESIQLRRGRLTVEHGSGSRVERAEFQPAWVRIEPRLGDRSLIELSGQGQRIAVGRFVRPELRRQLADELRWALRNRPVDTARGARRPNP